MKNLTSPALYGCLDCQWRGSVPSITDDSETVDRNGRVEVVRTHRLVCPKCFSLRVMPMAPEPPRIPFRPFKRILCAFGVHWSGVTGLGMCGDAACCDICGLDTYDILILNPRNPK